MPDSPAQAELVVMASVDASDDADFNAWYDQEHMAERLAIPGFLWGARWKDLDGARDSYLARYRTETLSVFRSEAYRAAFEHQTAWSMRNFACMRDPARLVGSAVDRGAERGAFAALLAFTGPVPDGLATGALPSGDELSGITLVVADADLSKPLPSASPAPALQGALFVEAASLQAARGAAEGIAALLAGERPAIRLFRLLGTWNAGA